MEELFALVMRYNSMIIEELRDCKKPGSLGVSASVFSVQLAVLIFNLDISEDVVLALIDLYIRQFSDVLSLEEQNEVRHYIGADIHIYSKVLSKEEPDQWMHIATNCIFEFTETPYDPADAVMVTTFILSFVTDATPFFPKNRDTKSWSDKPIERQAQPPKMQSHASQAMNRGDSMFCSETLSRVAVPAFIFAVVTLLTRLIIGFHLTSVYDIIVTLVGTAFFEFLSLLTCYLLVIANSKSQRHVWANYIIWMILLNLGPLAQYFGW